MRISLAATTAFRAAWRSANPGSSSFSRCRSNNAFLAAAAASCRSAKLGCRETLALLTFRDHLSGSIELREPETGHRCLGTLPCSSAFQGSQKSTEGLGRYNALV